MPLQMTTALVRPPGDLFNTIQMPLGQSKELFDVVINCSSKPGSQDHAAINLLQSLLWESSDAAHQAWLHGVDGSICCLGDDFQVAHGHDTGMGCSNG